MWVRLFCGVSTTLRPAQLAERLHMFDDKAQLHFVGDDLGWTAAEIRFPVGSPILIDRYLTDADDLRADLNTWAAYLETLTYSPNSGPLMERVIQTQEMITFRKPLDHPNEITIENIVNGLVQSLAQNAHGIYQADGAGWYNAGGELLVQEY